MRLLACLIVAPQRGYDEPAILSYAISSFCPTSADGLQRRDMSRIDLARAFFFAAARAAVTVFAVSMGVAASTNERARRRGGGRRCSSEGPLLRQPWTGDHLAPRRGVPCQGLFGLIDDAGRLFPVIPPVRSVFLGVFLAITAIIILSASAKKSTPF